MGEPLFPEALVAVIRLDRLLAQGQVYITKAMQAEAEGMGKRIAREVSRFLRQDAMLEEREPPPFDYEKTLDEVTSLGDFEAYAQRLADNSASVDPSADFAPAFMAAVTRALTHIRDTIPKRVLMGITGAKNVPPSDMEIYAYRRTYSVVDRPMVVLENMREGMLTSDEVQTLQAVYPAFHGKMVAEIQAQVMDIAAEKGSGFDLPPRKTRMLEIFAGQTFMTADLAKGLQDAFTKSENESPDAEKPGPSSSPDSLSTPAQRIADR